MRRWAMTGLAVSTAAIAVATGCGGANGPPPLRQNSQSYSFTIKPDDSPPHARQDIFYAIQVFDSKTRQPIENGEGQLFAGKPIEESAPTGPQSKTWDGLTYGPEIGTYHAKLNYVIAGKWAVAIRFRRDTLHPLERIDWMQDVLDERSDTTKVKAAGNP
jgi:hypothetical protein